MLSYFLSPEFTVSDKLVQVLYLLSGFFCMYSGIRSWTKKDSENPFATGFFWFTLGIIVAFGTVSYTHLPRWDWGGKGSA